MVTNAVTAIDATFNTLSYTWSVCICVYLFLLFLMSHSFFLLRAHIAHNLFGIVIVSVYCFTIIALDVVKKWKPIIRIFLQTQETHAHTTYAWQEKESAILLLWLLPLTARRVVKIAEFIYLSNYLMRNETLLPYTSEGNKRSYSHHLRWNWYSELWILEFQADWEIADTMPFGFHMSIFIIVRFAGV